MRYIDSDELSKDILDGEIEITGKAADLIQQAIDSYRSVILRRIIAQPTENVIPVEFIENEIKEADWMHEDGKISELTHMSITLILEGLLSKWETKKDEWLHQEK